MSCAMKRHYIQSKWMGQREKQECCEQINGNRLRKMYQLMVNKASHMRSMNCARNSNGMERNEMKWASDCLMLIAHPYSRTPPSPILLSHFPQKILFCWHSHEHFIALGLFFSEWRRKKSREKFRRYLSCISLVCKYRIEWNMEIIQVG